MYIPLWWRMDRKSFGTVHWLYCKLTGRSPEVNLTLCCCETHSLPHKLSGGVSEETTPTLAAVDSSRFHPPTSTHAPTNTRSLSLEHAHPIHNGWAHFHITALWKRWCSVGQAIDITASPWHPNEGPGPSAIQDKCDPNSVMEHFPVCKNSPTSDIPLIWCCIKRLKGIREADKTIIDLLFMPHEQM